MKPILVILTVLLLAPLVALHAAEPTHSAPTSVHDPKTAAELRVRDGLPNVFAKLTAGGPVRIAYLGGSITAANGWRPKSLRGSNRSIPTRS